MILLIIVTWCKIDKPTLKTQFFIKKIYFHREKEGESCGFHFNVYMKLLTRHIEEYVYDCGEARGQERGHGDP